MAGLNFTTRNKLHLKTITLAVGDTSTTDFQTGSLVVGALLIPTGLTGTALKFYGYIDDSATSYELTDFHDASAAFNITPGANKLIPIDFRKLASIGRWKLVSNAAQLTNPVTIIVLTREID